VSVLTHNLNRICVFYLVYLLRGHAEGLLETTSKD